MTDKENITAILECYFPGFKEEIIDSACNRIIQELNRQGIFRKGYDDGHKDGLNDAWECAKKIVHTSSCDREMNNIFGDDFYYAKSNILNKYSASEAITKIKEYEDKARKNNMSNEEKVIGTDVCSLTDTNCTGKDCETCDVHIKAEEDAKARTISEEKEMAELKDSGARRQFESGAVRDIAEGKGRCDLLPLDIVGELLNGYHIDKDNPDKLHSIEGDANDILNYIYNYTRTGNPGDIINAMGMFIEISFETIPKAMMEVSKHYEDGARKYAERNWEKGISCHCYVDSGVRHLLKWLDGWDDEPHDRAFIWNMLGLLWTVKHRPECNDLPYVNNENPGEFVEIPEPKSY